MKILQMEAGTGKSWACVEWLQAAPRDRVIVCPTERQAQQLRHRGGFSEGQVLSVRHLIAVPSLAVWLRDKEVAVDEVEIVLALLLGGGKVELITATAVKVPRHRRSMREAF